MDNPLTPNKIQRLMHLAADDKSFSMSTKRLLIGDEDLRRLASNQAAMNRSTLQTCESSSGILDLERVEGFGESGLGDMSLSKSTAFNPGEMTGRSTGADDFKAMPLGRHSIALENITSQMDKQTSEVHDIMRHSIASNNFTFNSIHSKRELTADEASLIIREAPLPVPVQNLTHTQFPEISINNSNLSVGAYFKNRCPEFGNILSKTDSPDRNISFGSNMPSISEVSFHMNNQQAHQIDQSLDCVPVRQPRNNSDNIEKQNNITKAHESFTASHKVQNSAPKVDKPTSSKMPEKPENFYMSLVPDKPKYVPMNLNSSPHKAGPAKETDLLIRNMQASLRLVTEDTEGSGMENSMSISKIADYIGKQSNVSVTDMLKYNNQKKLSNKKQPLNELHMNILENKKNQDVVTNLKDTRKMETASSSGTVNTVVTAKNYNVNNDEVPSVFVGRHSLKAEEDDAKSKRTTRSKSPSSKSQSTLSTVQENFTSFKSGDSPLQSSRGEANTSHVPSPNIVYKELDKSVDWREVMQQKHLKQESLAKEQWVDIDATVANGYVGVSCPIILTVTTLLDSWLTAKLHFHDLPNNGKDITIEMPRLPLLLSPGKSENISLNITSNVELNTALHYTMYIKDASIDGDLEQKGEIEVNIKMPVIQAMSCDGVNKVTFPPIQENTSLNKSFVLLSESPTDLQLVLTVFEGENIFTIKSVQEIKKSDVNKVLMDRQGLSDDVQQGKAKSKVNKQLCRLTSGNAIRVTIKFNAPPLNNLQLGDSILTFNGALNVNLIGVNSVLRKVDLVGVVGTVKLAIKSATNNKVQISHEPTNIELSNTGTVPGTWFVKFMSNDSFPFKVSPSKFDIRPGSVRTVSVTYTGTGEGSSEATLIFEDVVTGKKSTLEIIGGTDKPKTFPIKTNYNTISWVRSGRKELSLKNATNKKIYVRCQIVGDGFAIDMPREARGQLSLPFGPLECRPLPIIFSPSSNGPHKAMLHLVYDKNTDYSRKIALYGCASGDPVRWSGLVTYGDTALVRAVCRMPINLELYNKANTPAFVCASVHFNLQYMCVSGSAELVGGRHVVRARSRHALSLRVDWARVERRARAAPACALATLTVLTGTDYTRRRILKIVRQESNGELDISLLPDHLKVLAEKFEGEDAAMDTELADFKETQSSLNELIGGLQELTAQIDLPQDFAEEHTIMITDDTVMEHHTLCD